MAMTKLKLAPDNSNYSVTDGREVLATQLSGGAARYRRDVIGAPSRVTVQWILDREEYRYLRAFYKVVTQSGSEPFLIDLILDVPELTEHTAYFIPESMALTGQKGLSHTVSAQLDVKPLDMDETAAIDLVNVFNYFGPQWASSFPPLDDQLNTLMNISIPEDIA